MTCNISELRQHIAWFNDDDLVYVVDDKGNWHEVVKLLGMKDGKPRLAVKQVDL